MWNISFIPEAKKDLFKLDKSIRMVIYSGIEKVSSNPLPQSEGGYGKPLGNKHGNNLTGFFKIKYRNIGIRVVYTLVRDKKIMNIVVVSVRDDDYCYSLAEKRKRKYGSKLFEKGFENDMRAD
ncbi:type II toxin-antitoxin system RelE/ParE family toxin [Thermoanaerobacterium sp. CMT5567-10]|uniref:type II toxin-antitoxin system RelE family toxin n=1 Tax=Thermoanaerobacterium sp. CMT5567-10 TaxID=3061989 RepID=UPI0026E01F8B|nr:type II toxin-antitoxin system RelE/ParE family toxin [Thermoanaerobacterium sp. CMT5567-10]WKV09447.1 type II toxin-antitoxin system RelE/ParE family toxin [Thermoanaerobacterium sp. CMT5567-10]